MYAGSDERVAADDLPHRTTSNGDVMQSRRLPGIVRFVTSSMVGTAVALSMLAPADGHAQRPENNSRRASPDTTSVVITYPEMLRVAGVGGSVRFRVPVTAAGRADMSGFKVVHTDNALFQLSVKNTLPRWRFTPALVNGTPVVDTLDVEVVFVPPAEPIMDFGRTLSYEDIAPGRWRAVTRWPRPDPTRFPRDSATVDAIRIAVFDELLNEISTSDTLIAARIACISATSRLSPGVPHVGDTTMILPTVAMLSRLARPRVAVVSEGRCPPTFGSMAVGVDEKGRPLTRVTPPGENPWQMQVGHIQPWSDNAAIVLAEVEHGSGGTAYKCRVVRDAGGNGGWIATCQRGRSHVF